MILEEKIYDLLPEHLRPGIFLYIEKKIRPGSFLSNIIENNLTNVICGFNGTIHDLELVVKWFVWEAPSTCWGSKEKLDLWLKK